MKILSLCFIVLVAQANIAQGLFPIGSITGAILNTTKIIAGTVVGTTTAVVENVINTTISAVTNATNTINSVVGNIRDSITNLSSGPFGDVVKSILTTTLDTVASLPNITVAVLNQIQNLITSLPNDIDTLMATLKNATNISLPPCDLLSEIQNSLIENGSDILTVMQDAINNDADDFSNIAIPLTDVTAAVFKAIATKINIACAIFEDIVGIMENAITGIKTAVGNTTQTITNLLGATTACASQISGLVANTITSAAACMSTELATMKQFLAQLQTLSEQCTTEIGTGVLNPSTVDSSLTLGANIAFIVPTAIYRIAICEKYQAINVVSSIAPIVSSAIACIVSNV